LAINLGGKVTLYDTLDHQIAGVSQQQSRDASFTFVSQRGLVRLTDLPVVWTIKGGPAPSSPPFSSPAGSAAAQRQSGDIFAKIERLADLRAKGILSDEEFAAKKTELLSRI
jgi:hypothetical protein